jgi:predicted GIY-YIG superfamily endonuclease
MYSVYVLKDSKGNFYKGMTNNLKRRIAEHRRGETKTTKKMNGLEVVYKEEFSDKNEARKRELYFKSSAGRRFLKKELNNWGRSSAG